MGVCPETANPGEILKDFKSLPRLVGGIDDKTANIILAGFKLDDAEKQAVNSILLKHWGKLIRKAECKELKLRLKQHPRGKAFLHEIQADATISGNGKELMLSSSSTDYNLLAAVDATLDKLIIEAGHKINRIKK